ncbi:MAG: hypothetical protein LBS12_07165, partial [Prevotellaceae bacterium]|nr:hypothetical protein [Prevotellaceae bacterium]
MENKEAGVEKMHFFTFREERGEKITRFSRLRLSEERKKCFFLVSKLLAKEKNVFFSSQNFWRKKKMFFSRLKT